MKWEDFRKVSVCCDITEEEREKIDEIVSDKIKKKIGEKTPYSKIVVEKSDVETKKWILDIITKESMLSVRSQFSLTLYILVLTVCVVLFMFPDGIEKSTKGYVKIIGIIISSSLPPIIQIPLLIVSIFLFIVFIILVFIIVLFAIPLGLLLITQGQIASSKDLEKLSDNMDKKWHVIFIEKYSLLRFHLFNDIQVLIEEEAQRSMPAT